MPTITIKDGTRIYHWGSGQPVNVSHGWPLSPDAWGDKGRRHSFWLRGMMAGINAAYDCVKAFSETDHMLEFSKETSRKAA